jgi:MEDS: MEthanogen/methylotroph, DcmR Sensory domain
MVTPVPRPPTSTRAAEPMTTGATDAMQAGHAARAISAQDMTDRTIPVLLAGGDHVCALFRGPGERDRLLVSFLAAGLGDGAHCLLLATQDVGRSCHDLLTERTENADDLRIADTQSWSRDGASATGRPLAAPDVLDALDILDAWAHTAPARDGDPPARLAVDMSWTQHSAASAFVHDVPCHEIRATRHLASRSWMALCLYDLDLFGSDLILPLVKAHPKVLLEEMLVDNPYCPVEATRKPRRTKPVRQDE